MDFSMYELQPSDQREVPTTTPPPPPPETLQGSESSKGTVHKIHLVAKVSVASYPVGWPQSKRVALGGTLQLDHRNTFPPPLGSSVSIPSSTPFLCLSIELLVTTQGTQGSHLAPMVVLRAKDISDCGVSIIDNKAPRTLITLLPYVLRAHNQVRRGRR